MYYFEDGDKVCKGDLIGIIDGNMSSILMGEHVALNLLQRLSGITEAVTAVKDKIPFTTLIKVEVESLDDYKVALESGANIIMLDNLAINTMKEAAKLNNKNVILEASGNVTINNVKKIAASDVDIISVGALTHSVKSLDISLKFKY